MKKIIPIMLIVISCSNGRNELMTKLVNEKKIMTDSIEAAKNYYKYWENKYYEHPDTTKASISSKNTVELDSLLKWDDAKKRFTKKLSSISFSIDSLEKMK